MPISPKTKTNLIASIAAEDKELLLKTLKSFRVEGSTAEIHQFINTTSEAVSVFDMALETRNFEICLLLTANGASLDPEKTQDQRDKLFNTPALHIAGATLSTDALLEMDWHKSRCYDSALRNFYPEQILALVLRERLYAAQDFERSSHVVVVENDMGLHKYAVPPAATHSPYVTELLKMADTINHIKAGTAVSEAAATTYLPLLKRIAKDKQSLTPAHTLTQPGAAQLQQQDRAASLD